MGRAKKNPEYDPEKVMEQFTNCIVDAYGTGTDNNSLRKISEQFGITLMKTRKILITAGVYHTEISDQINSLWEDNWSISDIMKETGLSRSSVHSYLPYTKVIYNAEELSLYARRCRTYRKRKLAVRKLQSCIGGSMGIDRFILSTFVFAHYMFKQDRKLMEGILQFASQSIIPDFTFLCDLEAEVAYSRLIFRGKELSRREKQGVTFMNAMRGWYLKEIANSSKRYEIIRTDKVTIEEMEEYINVLEQYVY